MTNFEKVGTFMKTFGQDVKQSSSFSTDKINELRVSLIKEELGSKWLHPSLFRVGASSLLSDIERQIEHFVTGQYSSFNRHGMA